MIRPLNVETACQDEQSLHGSQYAIRIQPDDLAKYLGNEVYSVATDEGRLPVQRLPKLTQRKYFQARLLSENTRVVLCIIIFT